MTRIRKGDVIAGLCLVALTPRTSTAEVADELGAPNQENHAEPAEEEREDDAPPTLFGNQAIQWGGFLGPNVQASVMDRSSAVLLGLEGGVLLNRALVLGAAGAQLVSKVESSLDGPLFRMRYAGAVVRYQYPSDTVVYGSLGVLLGGGSVTREAIPATDSDDEFPAESDGYFVVEPSLQLHVNLTRWLRTGLQVSYRIVNGVDRFGLSPGDMSAASFGANLQFGWF